MLKKLSFFISALFIGLIFITGTASAVSLKIDPSLSNVALGDPLSISIVASDFAADQSLGAFDLDLNFDNTILSLGNVSFGNQLSGGLGSYQETIPGSGKIGLLEVSYESIVNLNNNQAPSFFLANLTFNTIGQGQFPLVLSVNDLSDAEGYPIIPTSVANGNVTVNAPVVPSPPVPPVPPVPAQVPLASNLVSMFLLIAGLGVVGARRKLFAKV